MCTGILHVDPAADWPVLLAFVRDEDRERPTQPPARWWDQAPTRIGGRDERAGGTWLAVDDGGGRSAPRVAFVQNRRDRPPAAPSAGRISRGELPGHVLDHGDLRLDAEELVRVDPFVLVLADAEGIARWWNWDGERLGHGDLTPGWHMVGYHGIDRPDLNERHDVWLPRFAAAPRPRPGIGGTTRDAWGSWIDLLDGRAARRGDPTSIVIVGVDEHPTFGTVGASLVALAPDAVRYDATTSHEVDPASWRRIDIDAMDGDVSG